MPHSTAYSAKDVRTTSLKMSSACSEAAGAGFEGGENGIMLFGVRVTEGTRSVFRKSASMNNLSQYEQPQDSKADTGYASDRSHEHKRGVPWTEEEHKLFLLGLQKAGKGDWRGISRNFVKTRTPTQVASHAQKFFLHRNNQNRRRRRSSLFDITTDTVVNSSMEEDQVKFRESASLPIPPQLPLAFSMTAGFPVTNLPMTVAPMVPPVAADNTSKSGLQLGSIGGNQVNMKTKRIHPIPLHLVPPSAKMADVNLNEEPSVEPLPLSLKLSTPSPEEHPSPSPSPSPSPVSHSSSFQVMASQGHDIM